MKIAILGASGFVGRNIYDVLKEHMEVLPFVRNTSTMDVACAFDLSDQSTWQRLIDYKPDVVINTAAYGVVKTQKELSSMYDTNYFHTVQLYKAFQTHEKLPFWFQIGTAFEYDLNAGEIDEKSICQPLTHYGISKLMCSQYFLNHVDSSMFTILRPFGMFGKYEDLTKIFPALMNAQAERTSISLSEGKQRRDYLYVKDLANFLLNLMNDVGLRNLPNVINVGSGQLRSLLEMSEDMASQIQNFDPGLWNWGELEFRSGESDYFYNSSKLAFDLGLKVTNHKTAFKNILPYFIK